ncbi:MAG: type II toxin-antitoxin system Phd/YefM family antitoxin [Chloroflexota bacterium]
MKTLTGRANPCYNAFMSEFNPVREAVATDAALTADISHPIILERGGQPVAVLMSVEEYRAMIAGQKQLSAFEARQAADHAMFGDLVGCALSSGDPIWSPLPEPHWRVPYRSFGGDLLAIVKVNAHTAAVSLTDEQRTVLLNKVEPRSGPGSRANFGLTGRVPFGVESNG